jgi:hypothetical protein
LLLAQSAGLLVQEGLQAAGVEPGGGGLGDLLHGVEVDIESGTLGAEGAAGDDVAPRSGEVTDILEVFGGELR